MNTVTFDEYNSYEHLGLILSTKTIGAPAPKFLSVDIPAGDGELDYTDSLGAVYYKNRALSFEFADINDRNEFLKRYSFILNHLNGRKMKVTLSDDPDFYYIGRVTVNEWKTEKNIGRLVIDVNAKPYKLKHAPTVIYRTIDKETVINCRNLFKTVIPKISFTTTGAAGSIVFNGDESDVFNDKLPDNFEIVFGEGDNVVTVKPAAAATLPLGVLIEYQEGSL